MRLSLRRGNARLTNEPSSGVSIAACDRDDITETGRSARETGRAELSGSADPRPIPARMALAIDFLTLRAINCFCRSDLALAGALLERHIRVNRSGFTQGNLPTGTTQPPPVLLCLAQHCRHPRDMQRVEGHIDGTADRDFSSSAAVSQDESRSPGITTYI